MARLFRKKVDKNRDVKAGSDPKSPEGLVSDKTEEGDNDVPNPNPPSKFPGPTTINGEGTMDAGETDGTADIPEEYRDANGDFKMMPVPRHLGSLTRRRPPLAVIVGLSGAGKSRLAAALMAKEGKEDYRTIFRAGTKTTTPRMVAGERLAVLDTPGLPDPSPEISDAYYNATVSKLRQLGYAHCLLFVLNQEKVTPTFIKNYGLLYRALNKMPCDKIFVCRREHSFIFQNVADQEVEEAETRQVVNSILEAANLKKWNTKRFFMLTNGSGEEQDKQIKYIREQVRCSPRVDIHPGEGLMLKTELAHHKAEEAAAKAKADAHAAGARGSWRKMKKLEAVPSVETAAPSAKTMVETQDKAPDKASSGCSVM